ncbi:hypothetical protein VNO77_42775 [Canavalia gladiata]|uniref:Cation/H+ exchanger domain-containing protein n=1 Tax=Canavalia gladiata TaxID=3824 RepID=A0AAN9JVU9_CANGL
MDTSYAFLSVNELPKHDYRGASYNVCIHLPPDITSNGVFEIDDNGASTLLQHPLTILELQIVTIFAITQCFHFLLKRLELPYFISSVMAGLVLGPTIKIGILEKAKKILFPFGSENILVLISIFGYTLHIFVNCVQMDFSMIFRTGKRVWAIALSSVLIPIFLGFLSTNILFSSQLTQAIGASQTAQLPVVFISHSACNFQVVAALLSDLRILNSELGHFALATALVSDVTSNLVTGVGTAVVGNMTSTQSWTNLAMLIGFVVLVPLIMRPVMMLVVRRTPEGRPVKKMYIYVLVFLMLVLGFTMSKFKQPVYASAIVLGLSVPEGPPLGSEIVKSLDLFSTWFLFPIFITSCIMKVDLTQSHTPKLILISVCFIFMVHLVKMMLSVGICWFCKMRITDGVCIALILGCKGPIDICNYTLIYDAQILDDQEIGVMVVSALVMGAIAWIGVKSLYDPSRKYAGYQKRNILSLKSDTELRIVACIHKRCHIIPTKNVLELCSPASNKPLAVDVLHLMELVGRSSPLFISHHQKISSTLHNFSSELIVTFNLFKHDYGGVAMVNTYTVISPFSLMHEDICYVAMDKIASLIILPFHVKWGEDGLVESADNNIRSLNIRVMEKAPCSIGILVNRASSKYDSSNHQVAMIFIGGSDDREALCLAKRSIKESDNTLCVFHLVAKGDDVKNWDSMLDDEVLREVQGSYGTIENVTYEEVAIEDASQTTSFLNNIANKFGFIIVGRRNGIKSPQTSALENWTEFSELGVIGDLLASPDMETRASILVVQQQLHDQ